MSSDVPWPVSGRLCTLKIPSCPAASLNLEIGQLSRHYIAKIWLNVTLNLSQQNNEFNFRIYKVDILTS